MARHCSRRGKGEKKEERGKKKEGGFTAEGAEGKRK